MGQRLETLRPRDAHLPAPTITTSKLVVFFAGTVILKASCVIKKFSQHNTVAIFLSTGDVRPSEALVQGTVLGLLRTHSLTRGGGDGVLVPRRTSRMKEEIFERQVYNFIMLPS